MSIHFLKRDGTNQKQRLLEALRPEFIPVDERTTEDLLADIYTFSKTINYFSDDHLVAGDWEPFFSLISDREKITTLLRDGPITQTTEPMLALLLTFLELMNYVRQDMNTITAKHLNFFVKKVLQLKPKSANPDQVHIFFELAKHSSKYILPSGTVLDGGKDVTGKPLLYTTDRELSINKAVVDEIKTVLIDKKDNHRIFAAPIANSADGNGLAFENEDAKWSPFGESQINKEPSEHTMTETPIGFALASPILLLNEGLRTITLSIKVISYRLTEASLDELSATLPMEAITRLRTLENIQFDTLEEFDAAVKQTLTIINTDTYYEDYIENIVAETLQPLRHLENDDLENVFRIVASGEKEWITLSDVTVTKQSNDTLLVTIIAGPETGSIIAYDSTVHIDTFSTTWPILKIFLSSQNETFLYDELKALQIVKVTINVNVEGVTNLILQNENSLLDPSKAFLPFGVSPTAGSVFYCGNIEVFQKKLASLTFHLTWADLPDDFSSHYEAYTAHSYDNSTFKTAIELLHNREWINVEGDAGTGTTTLFTEESGSLISDNEINIINFNGISRNYNLNLSKRYTPDVTKGFARFILQAPDFGHREFPTLYAQAAIELATAASPEMQLPNQPYTPKLRSVKLDYISEIDFDGTSSDEPEQLFHLEPFGNSLPDRGESRYLFPQLPEGALYIGLEDFTVPNSISLLFQVAEGSANEEFALEKGDISWSYLADNQWKSLSGLNIITDTTIGLQASGIVVFDIGRDATTSHTAMPQEFHWLRAHIDKNPVGASKMIDIRAQAVSATFSDCGNDPGHLLKPLGTEKITKLQTKIASIKCVVQPYTSFNGKAEEQDNALYTRVSERLRHKNRVVSVWDYERMVLEEFPSIYKVKCLPHTDENTEIAPGNVTLIVIPDLKNKNAINPLEPKVSIAERTKIKEFIKQYTPIFISVDVCNPIYEQVLVDFKVGFRQGFDDGYYGALLNEELKKYLSPWAYAVNTDISFDTRIYKSDILAFIEKRPYVDYVTDFKLFHLNKGAGIGRMNITYETFELSSDFIVSGDKTDVAIASSARSILVSAENHAITVLRAGEYQCASATIGTGIGHMIVEVDFIVT